MRPRQEPNWLALGVLVMLLAAVVFFACLGSTALSDRDEGEYAASVAEMRRSGDYLVPRLNGRLYLEKPILIFWAVAASQYLFGQNEFAARLPSALSAWLLGLLLLLGVRRAGGRRWWGVLSAAAFCFSPLVVLVGRAVLTDMLLTLFTTASLLSFFIASQGDDREDRRWYLAAWTCLGLGFLAKGPVALAVVLPPAAIYSALCGRLVHNLKRSRPHWGGLVFLAINLPWYGWAFYRLGEVFWQGFFVSQNLVRFSQVLLGHGGSVLYYLPVLLLGMFPFSALAWPPLLTALFKESRGARQASPEQRLRLFAAVSATWTVVVFSLAATKQINYVLPAMPFLAILAADLWHRLLGAGQGALPGRRGFAVSLVVLAALWAAALALAPWGLAHYWDQVVASIRFDSSEYALAAAPPDLGLWPWLAAGAAVLAAGAWLLAGRVRAGAAVAGGCLAAALFASITMGGLLGRVSDQVQAPAVEMARQVRTAFQGRRVIMLSYGLWKPSLLFYLDRSLYTYWVRDPFPRGLFLRHRPVVVFSRVRLADRLQDQPGFVELKRAGGYLLGGNQAARRLWRNRGLRTGRR